LQRLADILLLVVVCYLVFFGYLSDHKFIKTEGLRAVVVQEMRTRDGFTMPTVHLQPYLNKPPLYAWTTTWLSRQMDRFDEEVARLPSAAAGTGLVMLMYLLGERWIRRGAGLAAATFTLLCFTVTEYSVRAELDMPFTLFCTCNIVLTHAALRARGTREFALWLAAYAFALLAAMWKGPHSLIFMWLFMIGWSLVRIRVSGSAGGASWWRRQLAALRADMYWLRRPGQIVGAVLCLGTLVFWTRNLSQFAGAGAVGYTAAIELLARLVPHRLDHLLDLLMFLPMLLVITLPSSAFAVFTFFSKTRMLAWGRDRRWHGGTTFWPMLGNGLLTWWLWMRRGVRRQRLAAWIVPTLLFMLWAPAKSPRYCLPVFPPIILLGTLVALRLDEDRTHDGQGPAASTRVWRTLFALIAGLGVLGVAGLALALARMDVAGVTASWRPWAFLAIGCMLPLTVELLHPRGRSLRTRLILSLVALLAWQPIVHEVWWPLRIARESQRATAQRIHEIVPVGARLYVLGVHEYHDVAVYAITPFEFAHSLDDALARARALAPETDRAYAIFRTDETEELTSGATAQYTVLFNFTRADKDNVCVEIRSRDQ